MAYATLQDIQDELPQLALTATSKPNASQVGESITLIESHVNTVLKSRGYTVPITGGPESLKLLRKIVRHGVAAEVIRQNRGMVNLADGQKSEHQRLYDELLRDIFLPDATSGETALPFLFGAESLDEPVFTRGDVF